MKEMHFQPPNLSACFSRQTGAKMRNPLHKRLPRELAGDPGKYAVIFLFMTAVIGFVSGFLVAGSSMIRAYDDSFEEYRIEDGHFELAYEADAELLGQIEKEGHVELFPLYYLNAESDLKGKGEADCILRIYERRENVNLECLMEGRMPEGETEIAIDRMHADNNGLKVGDTITVGGRELTVTGLVAMPDYSALFSDNGDMMFDAVKFGVAVMSGAGFETWGEERLHYCYAWQYEQAPADENEEKEKSDELMKTVAAAAPVTDFLPEYLNQAIHFTGDDMGSDRALMEVLLYIVTAILAFVFAVTTNSTIVREAGVIGTLRASGYTRGELLRHYMTLPVLVTLIAAVIGNALGYTVFKNMVATVYYGSYSLPTYHTVWSAEAFVKTTCIPALIMLVINLILLSRKLLLSPLKFLRRELSKSGGKRAVRLPDVKFFHRFRLRIIFQNMPNYITLFVGLIFANLLLLFGMMMPPILERYQDAVVDHMIAGYQYILKAPVPTGTQGAEAYCAGSLEFARDNGEEEELSVYGIAPDSAYFPEAFPEDGVYISEGFAEKYRISVGDVLAVKEKYADRQYEFAVKGLYDYPAGFGLFMSIGQFRTIFGKADDYFNGYFSERELTDVDGRYIAATITEDDLTKLSRQLNVSMGTIFYLFHFFALALAMLLIYLLTKLIIEKNTTSISMVKILGYTNGEIGSLYMTATTWAVAVFTALSIAIAKGLMNVIYRFYMMKMTGWLPMDIPGAIYVEMFVMDLAAYAVVAWIQLRRIRRIPMDEALKNAE